MGSLTFERCGFARGASPFVWTDNMAPMSSIALVHTGAIEDSCAEMHVDFANKFVGGGCLENDFNMEEILFVVKPELIIAMALCSFLQVGTARFYFAIAQWN